MLKSCRFSCMKWFRGTHQFGIRQRLPSTAANNNNNNNERTLTEARLAQSIEYMQRIWGDGAESRNVRHKCRNQHEDCTFWAASGECEKNPTYMDVRHRCPIGPDNPSIWGPGDLDAMMERVVDDADGTGEFARYRPRALSRPATRRDGTAAAGVEGDGGPWVVVLEDFVSSEEADRLVEIGTTRTFISFISSVGRNCSEWPIQWQCR